MIPPTLARLFPDTIRARGAQYFREGRVLLLAVDGADTQYAEVLGTRSYQVLVSPPRGLRAPVPVNYGRSADENPFE